MEELQNHRAACVGIICSIQTFQEIPGFFVTKQVPVINIITGYRLLFQFHAVFSGCDEPSGGDTRCDVTFRVEWQRLVYGLSTYVIFITRHLDYYGEARDSFRQAEYTIQPGEEAAEGRSIGALYLHPASVNHKYILNSCIEYLCYLECDPQGRHVPA